MQSSDNQFALGLATREEDRFARVRVVGRGTCRESPTFKHALASLAGGGWRRVRFDVSGCSHMDSSFAGTLAGFVRPFRGRADAPRFELVGASEALTDTLDSLLVLRLFQPAILPEPAGLVEKPFGPVAASRVEHTAACRQAHEELSALGPENAARFDGVVRGLTAEEERLRAAEKSAP